MAKIIPLDKIITQGTEYTSHSRACYLIQKIGTDATSSTHLDIDGVDMGAIVADVAPLRKTSSYIVGPLDLGDLPYAIPPDTDFKVEGASGANVRLIGVKYQLAPGEAIPGNVMNAFNRQGSHYRRYVTGSYSFGAATAWSDGTEVTLYTLTPATIETYTFNNILMVDYAGFTANPGDVVIILYLDNTPLEYLTGDNVDGGFDLLSLPHRDDVASNEEPFTLKDHPVTVEGDHTFKVTAKNVSGADISLSSASITLYAVCDYQKRGGGT